MELRDCSLAQYSADLAARKAIPGGGAAAALTAAQAAALAHMALIYSQGPDLAQLSQLEGLRLRFLDLMEADAKAFLAWKEASVEERNQASCAAARVPLELLEELGKLLRLIVSLRAQVKRFLYSDLLSALELGLAAFALGRANVLVNLRLLPPGMQARQELEAALADCELSLSSLRGEVEATRAAF